MRNTCTYFCGIRLLTCDIKPALKRYPFRRVSAAQVLAVLFASSDVVANVDLQTMPMYTCLVTSFVFRQLLVLVFPLAVLGCTACITAVRSTVYRVAASHHPSIVLRAEPEPGYSRRAAGGGGGLAPV